MTRITRVSCLTLPTLLVALISAAGCSSSNAPPTTAGAGGSTGNVTKTGGAPSTAATGGGSAAPTGGTATAGGAGDTGGSATAGATGGTPSTSTVANPYTPSCTGITTAAGAVPSKGVACTTADTQLCYKACGPENKGFKSETCASGAYAEEPSGPPCHFLPADYSCYKVPTSENALCPATPPQHGTACSIAPCIPCGFSGGYLDSSGAAKTGFCVCIPAAGTATQKWGCATYPAAWPCGPNMSAGSTGCT